MAKFAANIGEDIMVSGEFGEALLAYYFVKKKLHIIMARSVGFDLIAKDTKGKIFPKNKQIAISVKSRQSESFSIRLDDDIKKLKNQSKIWKLEPYFGFVTPKEALIFPVKLANHPKVRTKGNMVSFPNLKKLKSKEIIHLEWNIGPKK